jgi:hypothetical protein
MKSIYLEKVWTQKKIAIVCNNALANTSLVERIYDWLSKLSDCDGPKHIFYMIYRFTHTIHRVVLILLEYVDLETTEIRSYVKSLNQSPKLLEELRLRICERNKSLPPKDALTIFEIPLDVKTR